MRQPHQKAPETEKESLPRETKRVMLVSVEGVDLVVQNNN
jgi:hypothetical protein